MALFPDSSFLIKRVGEEVVKWVYITADLSSYLSWPLPSTHTLSKIYSVQLYKKFSKFLKKYFKCTSCL